MQPSLNILYKVLQKGIAKWNRCAITFLVRLYLSAESGHVTIKYLFKEILTMKKFTILVALILCVTIGGVYATWTYQGGEVQELHQHFNVYMGAVDNDEAKGVLKTVMNALSIKMDDADNNYVAEAVVEGYIEFVFAPKANASDTVRDEGIDLTFTLVQTDPAFVFEGVNVFTITNGTGELGMGEKITAQNASTLSAYNTDLSAHIDSFYYCVKASDLADKISTDISLPTYEDYQAMVNILNNSQAHIGISVNEK